MPFQVKWKSAQEKSNKVISTQIVFQKDKWQLPDLLRSEISFEIARKAFELDNREVVDAIIGGKCQIFKRIEYQSLFD